jgi:hypothetical protein
MPSFLMVKELQDCSTNDVLRRQQPSLLDNDSISWSSFNAYNEIVYACMLPAWSEVRRTVPS